MPEIPRNRDCYVLVKDQTITVTVDTSLVSTGWTGGQGVMWAPSTKDELLVKRADGYASGFLLWGSNEISDQFTAITGSQSFYRFGVLGTGSWMITTTAFETHTYASRQVGPLVPLTYNVNDRLRFSLRGLWTKEDEWTLSGDPRAPNTFYFGTVSQTPTADRNNHMTIQVVI